MFPSARQLGILTYKLLFESPQNHLAVFRYAVIRPILLICPLLLSSALPIFALDPNQSLAQLYHTSWSAGNGLNGSVMALAQTTDGYLWIGSDDGLYRFDGLSFERFRPDDGFLLASSISALMAVRDGGLWIGYTRGGATFLKDGRATNYTEKDGFPVSLVRRFAQTRDGTIWAAVRGGFTRLEGTHWKEVGKNWNYPSRSAWSIFVDRQGSLWVASGNRIVFLQEGGREFQDIGITTGEVTHFAQSPDGTIFFYDDGQHSIRAFRSPLDRQAGALLHIPMLARSLLFDRDGVLWIAGTGLSRLPFVEKSRKQSIDASDSDVERLTDEQGLTSDIANTILEDREGNIWIGTEEGLDRFRRRNLTWSRLPLGTRNFTLVTDDSGNVWAGSSGDKQWRMIRISDGKPIDGSPHNVITAYRSPDGVIWISAKDKLIRWKEGNFTEIAPPEEMESILQTPRGKEAMIASSITSDKPGNLWVSIGGGGEFRLRNGIWKFIEVMKDHPDWAANAAFTDAQDRIWLSFGEMVVMVDHGSARSFNSTDGLTVGPFNIISGRGQQIWVGGESGLAFLRNNRFYTVKHGDGSDFDSVTGIIVMPDDGLWLSTAAGIVHIPEKEVQHVLRQTDYRPSYEIFDQVSDLPDPLQNSSAVYSPGVIEGANSILWFTTRKGVARVDTRHIFKNPVPPPVSIHSVIADEKSYSPLATTTLPALTRNLRIDFTALSLSIPERVRFRYRLDGWEENWQDAGVRRQAFYTNLRPGKYVFHVIACNNDGIWNETGAIFDFTLAPAWFQTLWFRLLCAFGTLGILWAIYLFRLRQATAHVQEHLSARLEERERIARELHDTLLQGFQGLVLRFQAVMKRMPDRDPVRDLMECALDRADEVLLEGRQRVRDLRQETITGNELPDKLAKCGEEFANEHAALFSLAIIGTQQDLDSTVGNETYRIGREAVTNAFLHAEASKIEAEITYDYSRVRLRVRDDGIGIDPKILNNGRAGHWGMPGMRERARKIGGELKIWSHSGAGTEIDLTIPATVAYPRSGKRSRWLWIKRLVSGGR